VVEVGTRFLPLQAFSDAELLDPFQPQTDLGRHVSHPYMGYAPKPSWASGPESKKVATHNALGFRGPLPQTPKPEGLLRIVCLGGSSTYGTGPSSDKATWPAQLEVHLNKDLKAAGDKRRVEVINGGSPGWTTFESLANYAFRMVDLEPDLVLVYHATNDAGMAVYQGPVRGDNTHARKAWEVRGLSPVEKSLEHSQLFLLWRRYVQGVSGDQRSLGAYTLIDREASLWPSMERLEDPGGFANFERNLRSIAGLVRTHGAKPVFVTQAHLPADDSDAWVHGRARVAALERNLEIQARLAVELDVPLIDARTRFDQELAAKAAKNTPQNLLLGTVHLRDQGARLMGRFLAKEIQRQGLLP
ncbi:MAG: lysophospholipase L1-like esterase, partial [Planctomycetota bacterium]